MNRQLITYKSLLPVQTNPATSDSKHAVMLILNLLNNSDLIIMSQFKNEEFIVIYFKSVFSSNCPKEKIEVIVLDNGSANNSYEEMYDGLT